MNHENRIGKEDASAVSDVVAQAIRRLNFLGWIILVGAGLLAGLGGALVSWLIAPHFQVSFRLIWLVVSILLLVVPGIVMLFHSNRGGGVFAVAQKLRTEKRDGRQ